MRATKTEDSFAELAKDYSEDTGSAENGGLYDTVYKGATVEEFDKFCFEGHKKGDTAIVYGESSSYAGYHVMYYVGEGDLYSNLLAKNDLVNTTVSQWVGGSGQRPDRHERLVAAHRGLINPYLSTGEGRLSPVFMFLQRRILWTNVPSGARDGCWARARWRGCEEPRRGVWPRRRRVVVRGSACSLRHRADDPCRSGHREREQYKPPALRAGIHRRHAEGGGRGAAAAGYKPCRSR